MICSEKRQRGLIPRHLLQALLLCVGLLSACGQVRPLPPEMDLAAYSPIALEQLRRGSPDLKAGDRVRLQAYFWEFLSYDPVPQHYYLNQLRYLRHWGDLEWFALYQEPTLRGYFDLATMSAEQRRQFAPKRLEPLILFGELVNLGGGRLYLQTHHLERLVLD